MSLIPELALTIIADVIAGIILYFVCKWLDGKKLDRLTSLSTPVKSLRYVKKALNYCNSQGLWCSNEPYTLTTFQHISPDISRVYIYFLKFWKGL